MNREAFNRLVLELEARAQAGPRAHRLRVAALAALGYAYILIILAAMATLLAGVATLFYLKPNAHAFVLSRVNEYEADAHAAHLAGTGRPPKPTAGSAAARRRGGAAADRGGSRPTAGADRRRRT